WSQPFSKRNLASSSESTCEVPYSFFDSFFFRFTTSPERRTTTSCSYVFPSIVIAPNIELSIVMVTYLVIFSFRHGCTAATQSFETMPVAARNAFQMLGLGHGIRHVGAGQICFFRRACVTESSATMSNRARLRARARGLRLILFLIG